MNRLSITVYHEVLSDPPLITFHIERESNGDTLGSGHLTVDETQELIIKLNRALKSIAPVFTEQ